MASIADKAESAHSAEKDLDSIAKNDAIEPGSDDQDAKELSRDNSNDDATNDDGLGQIDGGLDAWLVCAGGWCCSLASPGWVNSVGAFQQYYEVGPLKGYSADTIAWIPSLQIFFLFVMGPFVGVLYDKYGARTLIIVGTLIDVFGLMMASLATEYYQFLLSQGVCSAIGVSFIYTPAIASLSTWFVKRRGFAMGIMVTGSSVGGVIFPIMISRMIDTVGYPWAIRTAAFLILALQIVPMITVKPRTPPVPRQITFKRYFVPFGEFPFAMLLLGMFFLTFGIYLPVEYLASSGYEVAHMSEQLSQYLISIFNAASLFGRLIAGYLADIFGRWNAFIISCALCGVAELAVWLTVNSPAGTIGFAVFFGFVSGAFTSLSGALPVSVSPPEEIGYRLGLTYLALAIPALIMGVIGGAIIGSGSEGWNGLKIFAGLTAILGAAITLYSRWLYTDKKLFKRF